MSEFFTEEERKAWLEDLHEYGKSKLTEAEYGAINVDWWNAGCEAGAKSEQKRIIKLLESLYCGNHTPDEKCDTYPNFETCYVVDEAIALIKGENK
jgi:hypothetical protein